MPRKCKILNDQQSNKTDTTLKGRAKKRLRFRGSWQRQGIPKHVISQSPECIYCIVVITKATTKPMNWQLSHLLSTQTLYIWFASLIPIAHVWASITKSLDVPKIRIRMLQPLWFWWWSKKNGGRLIKQKKKKVHIVKISLQNSVAVVASWFWPLVFDSWGPFLDSPENFSGLKSHS